MSRLDLSTLTFYGVFMAPLEGDPMAVVKCDPPATLEGRRYPFDNLAVRAKDPNSVAPDGRQQYVEGGAFVVPDQHFSHEESVAHLRGAVERYVKKCPRENGFAMQLRVLDYPGYCVCQRIA